MKYREIVKLVTADGWYFDCQKGSQQQFKHPVKPGKVTIPYHGTNDDLIKPIVQSILKQAVEMKRKYLVEYYKTANNFSGHAPDILGCVSVGDTLDEMRSNMKEALEFHFEGTVEVGISIPEPTTTTVDFSPESEDFDPNVLYTVVEWLEVEVPVVKESRAVVAAD